MRRILTESYALVKLGLPVALAHVFQVGLQVVDTIMAGQYGAKDLAGISLAGSLTMPLMILMIGTVNATTPIVAQLAGAGRFAEAGFKVRQGMWVGLGMVMLIIAIIINLAPVLGWFAVPRDIAGITTSYLSFVIWGYPAWAMFLLLRTTAEGLGHTRPPMYIALASLIINIPLNYAFIFGKFGAPELGGAGCGVATAIVMWFQLTAMLLLVSAGKFRQLALFSGQFSPDITSIREYLTVGLPIGLKIFGPVGVFASSPLFIARYGELPVAAGSIGGNVTTLAFMVPIGFATAATIRIGQAVGREDSAGASLTSFCSIATSMMIALIIGVLMFIYRYEIAGLYTSDKDLLAMTASLLIWVAFYQFADATQEPAVGSLRGFKDTQAAMWYSIGAYWLLALPLGTLLAYGYLTSEPMTVFGYWTMFIVAESIVALLAGRRLMRILSKGKV